MYSLKNITHIILLFFLVSCGEAQQNAEVAAEIPAEKGISYDDSTRQALNQLLENYYSLKDALVAADSTGSAKEAAALVGVLENFSLYSVQQSDPVLYASVSELPLVIKKNASAISNTTGLEAQRVIFQTVSDNLYMLVKNLKPAGIQTYQQYCPMAFDDKGAAWLSDTMHIQNPYFGKKMLTCGEVQDTLKYQ